MNVERLREQTELSGPVTRLDQFTVGSTVVVLSADAEVEGSLRVGSVVKLRGSLLQDGRFWASKIERSEQQETGGND